MKPQLSKTNNSSVSAQCPNCQAITSFDMRQAPSPLSGLYPYKGKTYKRLLNVFSQCARCGHGGLAIILDDGDPTTAVLESFFPLSIESVPIPKDVPDDILKEFREAEKCASFGANRAASALFRSVLEKTLKANGYTKANDRSLVDLQKRIHAAAGDGVITEARQKKAHDDIRSLGNDVMHDDWREVKDNEVEDAHRHTQRILEDFYDDRITVERILTQKSRLPAPPQPPTRFSKAPIPVERELQNEKRCESQLPRPIRSSLAEAHLLKHRAIS